MNKSFEITDDTWVCKNYVKFTIDNDKITKLDIDSIDLTNVKDVGSQIIKLDLLYKIYTKTLDEHLRLFCNCTQEDCQQIKNIIFNSSIDLNGVKFINYKSEDNYEINGIEFIGIKTYGDAFKLFGHPDHEYEYPDGNYLYIDDITQINLSNIKFTGYPTQLVKLYTDMFDTINEAVNYNLLFKYTKLHPYLIDYICRHNQYYLQFCYSR